MDNPYDYPAERIEANEAAGIKTYDANGQMFHYPLLLHSFPTDGLTAELDWSLVKIVSAPHHKRMMNASIAWVQDEDGDALDLLKRLWAGIQWETIDDYPLGIATLYQNGKPFAEWVRLVHQ